MKTLKSILLNTNGNKLRLADIRFGEKIEEIVFRSDEFDWNELSDADEKNNLLSKFSDVNYGDDEIIDGEFNLAIPGAIDPHVHFNTPGFEEREDFEHATAEAARGGVTTIVDMPCTSVPPVTNVENMIAKLSALKGRSLIDYAFWGGVRGDDFTNGADVQKQINELSEAGVAGFKVYVISGMSDFKDLSYKQITQAAEWIKPTGKPMGVHAEDKFLVESRRNDFVSRNKTDWNYYCIARDIFAEEEAIRQISKIAEATGARVHIVHLSSFAGLELVRVVRDKGIALSAETCPHYLFFTQDDFGNDKIRNFLKTAPPVKFEKDREELWKGLADGSLEFVTTDHAGCNPDTDKSSTNFWEVYGGIPGAGHRVPFLFSEGFLKGRLTLDQTVKHLSVNAAEYFGLKEKGKLEAGQDADVAIVNLWKSGTVLSDDMRSKGKYTPFEGIEFNAVVETTMLRGKIIFSLTEAIEPNFEYGRFVKAEV